MLFREEAENCRRKAIAYVGKPEAPFLLSVARAFDELDRMQSGGKRERASAR